MEFQLSEYRQGVTGDELTEDVRKIAKLVGNKYLSYQRYRKAGGRYGDHTFRRRFGSWTKVLAVSGLEQVKPRSEMKKVDPDNIISDVKRIAAELNSCIVTSKQYEALGAYAFPTVIEKFGIWKNLLENAGLSVTGFIAKYSDIEVFTEIERIWTVLGRQPTTTDLKRGISRISLEALSRRFGGWRNTLVAFLEYVSDGSSPNQDDLDNVASEESVIPYTEVDAAGENRKKRTPRNINLRLRFRTLQLDAFKCRACGASPAKNPETELHVDHIVPWSKGGETELDNLQTLCSKCNLGKSNLHNLTHTT
ncbi:homing endonuclease associated repeat-containing protein [Cyanobium sp. LEGE 06113]|uniref:homing endonuclease associated repeat-containing protein n=1 Tax=Cyanobium sp. LEGE 06113 TaxID=1297573 RepID=UPI00187F06CA|nr:HNH endonuclease [Cyanobium sp. LEGE 06113]MBE9154241.1 HNH endonuclease [Cyanobium sp. LEGE 06113]